MEKPFFSIIIPTYNSDAVLSIAIGSILSQEFSDFEILVIDGLSKDNTVAVARSFNDSRIRITSEKDEGIYDAMNKGIRLANGRWLYFLGSDDKLYDRKALQSAFEFLQSQPCDFLYGDVIMSGNKRYDGVFSYEKLLNRNISHQAIFYAKEVFEKIGVYNTRYRLHADWDFNIRCFESGRLNICYNHMLIAFFGEGGASSAPDKPFLREEIIPRKLRILRDSPRLLRNVRVYDEWWRLLRNAAIGKQELDELFKKEQVVNRILVQMHNFQSRFSPRKLRIGVFSKLVMTISYLRSLL